MTETVTAHAPEDRRLQPAGKFIEALLSQRESDRDSGRAKFAVLKRNAGKSLAEAISRGQGVTWIFGLLNRYATGRNEWEKRRDEELLFLVATLLAFDKRTLEGKNAFTGNMGRSFLMIAVKPPASKEDIDRRKKSLAPRFHILLDSDLESDGTGELAYRLRQTVALILSRMDTKDEGIDWPHLLADLRDWDRPDRRVQKAWARSFYAPSLDQQAIPTLETRMPDPETVIAGE